MSEPRMFKRGALRRSGSACGAASATQLLSATPCAAADGAGFGSRRPPSPHTADAAQSGEEAGGPSPQKRHRPSAAERTAAAPCAEADPFDFEGSEAAAAAAHAPRIGGRSALHRNTQHARGQVDAKRVTWGLEPTIHEAPARETQSRSAGFDVEPRGGGGGGWAPASHARPLSVVRDSGVQLAAVDEARYSLQSLSAANSLEVRRSAAIALVTLAADPDTRRLLRSHRLSPLILKAACELPVSALALPAAALFYLLSCDRPPADDALALVAAAADGALARLLSHGEDDEAGGLPLRAEPDAAAGADSGVRCMLRRARLPLAAGEVVDTATLALLTVELGCCLPAAPGGAGCDNVRAQFKAALRRSGALGVVAAHTAAAARRVALAAQQQRTPPAGPLLRCLRVLEQTSFEDATSAAFLLRWRPDRAGGAGSNGHDEPPPRSRSASPDLLASNPRGGVSAALAWLGSSAAPPQPNGTPHGGANGDKTGDTDPDSEAAISAATRAAQAGGVVAALVAALPALSTPACEADACGAAKTCSAAIRATLNALTNLTNDRADGGAAFLAAGGVEAAAALLPGLVVEALGSRFVDAIDAAAASLPAKHAPAHAGSAAGGSGADALSAALCLLTNVVEVSPAAAVCLAAARTAAGAPFVHWLATLFVRTDAASAAGVLTGSGAGASGGPSEDADVTAEMLEASEREAVALITAAYTALLLGCVLRSAPEARQLAAKALPGGRLSPLSTVLERFCSFHESMRTLTPHARQSMRQVIDTLKTFDAPQTTQLNGA